jgi:hypothetical protein
MVKWVQSIDALRGDHPVERTYLSLQGCDWLCLTLNAASGDGTLHGGR